MSYADRRSVQQSLALGVRNMGVSLRDIKLAHSCFTEGKPNNKGRILFPVSPDCSCLSVIMERRKLRRINLKRNHGFTDFEIKELAQICWDAIKV
jgi:hypothetical protein